MSVREAGMRGGTYLVARRAASLPIHLTDVLLLMRTIGPKSYGIYAAALGIHTVLYTAYQCRINVYVIWREGRPHIGAPGPGVLSLARRGTRRLCAGIVVCSDPAGVDSDRQLRADRAELRRDPNLWAYRRLVGALGHGVILEALGWWALTGPMVALAWPGTTREFRRMPSVSPDCFMPDRSLVSMLMNDDDCDPLLGDAIESAVGQTYSNVEVAVVNDGFTNDSWDAMSLFGERIVGVE
jgi:hypothetical protein